MALKPADIAVISSLLDDLLALAAEEREPWLAALPPVHQRHVGTLRDMLAEHARLDEHHRLDSLPRLPGDESTAHPDDRVGPYRLLREIGCGGMGSVWLAARADGAYNRQVALKLPRLAWGAGLAERMAREREIGMLLEHPNIARLYDAGVDGRGRPFLALEFVDGQPIDAWCEAQGLSVRDRLKLFVQIVKAVAYAHGRLVVHRDLKPSNVLVTSDGQAHLLDFGIAKLLQEAASGDRGLTQEQGRVLTPHYASPEQVAGAAITVQSDVYSLGVLLFELLTGTLPISPKRDTLGAVEDAILAGDAPLASSRVKDRLHARALRGEVDAILAKAMQLDMARRYATADALALDIERHLNGETVAARPDSLAYRLRKVLKRNWIGFSAAAAVLAAVLTGSGVAVVQAQRASRSAERERVVKEFVSDVFRVGGRGDARNTALRPASPQALIEGGAQLIQQRFAGQPELQAELFAVVSTVFTDMGAYRQAAEYSTRRVETLAALRADPIEQARAWLTLAEALVDDRHFADAEPRIHRVLQLINGDRTLEVEARVLLAQVQLERGMRDQCEATLGTVDAMLNASGGAPSLARAKSMLVRGRLLRRQNRADEAFQALQRAVDIALTVDGRLSATAIAARLTIAHARATTARDDLALAAFAPAVSALHELGGAHQVRALMAEADFAWRRQTAFQHITINEVVVVLDRTQVALAALNLPIPAGFFQELAFRRGELLTLQGEVQRGLALMEPNLAPLLALAATPVEEGVLWERMGHALLWGDRFEAADAALRVFLDAPRRAGSLDHPYNAPRFVFLSQNLRMSGKFDEALAVLDSAPRFPDITGEGLANPERYSRFIDWERAAVFVDRRDFAAALKLLQATTLVEGEDRGDLAQYEELRGIAECSTGQARTGLGRLKRALTELADPSDGPNAPWIALLRGRLGLCALAVGDRGLALESARLARAAFVAQPQVRAYAKAPLIRLERVLGLKLPAI